MNDVQSMTPEELARTPAMPPPDGVTPNFVDPESRAPSAIAALSLFLAVMVIILSLKLYSRWYIVKKIGLDDWAALAAGISGTVLTGVMIAILRQGVFGPHTWNVPLARFMSPGYNSLLLVPTITNPLTNCLSKVSISLLLLSIFPRIVAPKTAYLIDFGLGINILFHIIYIIWVCVVCAPKPGANGQLHGSCSYQVRMDSAIATAAMNALLDLYMLGIAVPSLWRLQMPLRRRLGAIAVLGTGMVTCGISITCLYFRITVGAWEDPAWNQMTNFTLATIEPLLAVITACLPSLPPIWRAVVSKISSISQSTSVSQFTRSGRIRYGVPLSSPGGSRHSFDRPFEHHSKGKA